MTSIYIIAFHRFSSTLKCLHSLQRHLSPPYEVVLVENSSATPHEMAEYERLMASWPAMRLVKLDQQRHCPWIRARVLEHTCGDHIFFMDNDCFVEDDIFPRLVSELEKDERTGGISPALLYFPDRTLQCLGIDLEVSEERLFHPRHLCHNETYEKHRHRLPFFSPFIPGGCSLFRRAFLEECQYDDRLRNVFGDYDLCLQGGERGWHYKFHPGCYVLHHKASQDPQYMDAKARLTDWLGSVRLFEKKWNLRYFILKHIEEGRVVLDNGQFPRWLPRQEWPENRPAASGEHPAFRKP